VLETLRLQARPQQNQDPSPVLFMMPLGHRLPYAAHWRGTIGASSLSSTCGVFVQFRCEDAGDSEEAFHRAPQLASNGGDQQKAPGTYSLTSPESELQEVFNTTEKPVRMARFTLPCAYSRYLLLSSQSYLRVQS